MATPAGTDATQKLGKAQYAYEWIKVQILEQAFTPGYRLVLANIAQTLSMSVVPVREAIRRLEAEGLVTFERNVGARVSMVDGDQYRYSMEALGILEGAATAQSAVHLTSPEIFQGKAIFNAGEKDLRHEQPLHI